MFLALAVAVGSVLGGAALVLLGVRNLRAIQPVRTFALVAAVIVVLGQLLPAAMADLGLWALLVFGITLVLPAGFEWIGRISLARRSSGGESEQRDSSWIAVELGYIGLLWHKLADGMALGLFGGSGPTGVVDVGILAAIAAHTIPITAVLVLAYADRYSTTHALFRAGGVALATCLGVVIAGTAPLHYLEAWEPWVMAAASGLLLHVIGHDWHPEAPRDLSGRIAELTAVAAGIGLAVLSETTGHSHSTGYSHSTGHSHSAAAAGEVDVRVGILDALAELTLETAPILLFGLGVGALLQTFGAGLSTRWLGRGSSIQQALRGAVVGAPLPICACRVLPLAESLRERGGGPALVVAFLLATPELGVESFALTVRFLGWPFALARLGAAIVVAMIAALVVARFFRSEETSWDAEAAVAPGAEGQRSWRSVLYHFDELLHHVGPFALVGLVLAAYVQVILPVDSVEGWAGSGLGILVISIVAIPSYVCAAAATPLAAVLIGKGFSSGAVLAGLLLGPATNLAAVGFLRRSYGPKSAWLGLAGLILSVWAFSLLANYLGLSAVVEPEMAGMAHDRSLWTSGGSALLAIMLMRAIWKSGLRIWLATLADAFGSGHRH